jgi:hypothetical protein
VTGRAGSPDADHICLSRLSRGRAELALVNPMDYFLYLPLLPEVAAGVIDPRRVAVSLPETLPDVRLILGAADRTRGTGGSGRTSSGPRSWQTCCPTGRI